MNLPTPYAPRSRAFQQAALESLRRIKVRPPGRRTSRDDAALDDVTAAVEGHLVARDPNRETRLRAAVNAERLEREIQRLERRVQGRTESLAHQLDRVLALLEGWGYVEGWSLTPAGAALARLYTETDLLLAEALREGVLDGLNAAETAAVVSCFTYERRGPDDALPTPPPRWPSSQVAQRARAIQRIWQGLVAAEHDAGLPETRPPDPGFSAHLYEWVQGDELGAILDDELAAGDFVRNVKQCIDLLRQVADVATVPETRAAASEAATACLHGVVAVAGAVVA
jgi:ATP-dependent RNA helicase HelY